MGFHRIVGHTIFAHARFPRGNPFGIGRRVGRLEVVPSGEVTDEVSRVEAREFLFTNRKRHDGDIVGRDARGRKLFVETNVGVPIDRRNHPDLAAIGRKFDHIRHDRRPVGMTEGRVVDEDIFGRDAFVDEIGFEDVVRGPRVHIVGPKKREFLNT